MLGYLKLLLKSLQIQAGPIKQSFVRQWDAIATLRLTGFIALTLMQRSRGIQQLQNIALFIDSYK